MRGLLLSLICVAAVGTVSGEQREPKRGTESDVIVARLDEAIPEKGDEAQEFLWDRFSHRPEIKWFQHYSTKDWRKNYDLFSAALAAKAKKDSFEAEALQAALVQLLKEPADRMEIAYLPISAYRTTRNNREVWAVLCLWEYAGPMNHAIEVPMHPGDPHDTAKPVRKQQQPEWLTVGHFRVFAYYVETHELAGFVTCD